MQTEQKRLNEVFDNYYYKELSSTNRKEPINHNTILDLFNDFMLMSQIVHSMINNGKKDLPSLKILDAGCGNGRMLRKFCELGAEPTNCFGIDLSKDIIKYAHKNSSFGIAYHAGDIKDTPYCGNTFDIIFNLGVLIHIKDNDYIKEIAKEFHRVLKPGGLVFITVAREGSSWGERVQAITRNFTEGELLDLFDMFQCLGVYDTYSSHYSTVDHRNVTLSQIMRAYEVGAVDSTYKLAVFKR
ncbi:MAG: class I SAM-dependent methyltransferase [Dehalococcoidales bacterium]|nr:class I SAM-dependent methyltransferase [Dehalococcoidales bacterium]